MTVRHREALSVRCQLEQVGRQAGLGKAVANRRKDRFAVQSLQRLEAGVGERAEQRPGRWGLLRALGGHLWQELGEPGLGQSLGAKEPDPADFFRRETAVARLAP